MLAALMPLAVLAAALQTPAPPVAPAAAAKPVPVDLTADQVMDHLNQVVSWYRRIATVGQSPTLADNALARERLQQTSTMALRLVFDFAHAAAALVGASPEAVSSDAADSSPGSNDPGELQRVAARLDTRIAGLQAQLNGLDDQIPEATPKQRPVLVAQREQTQAALALARQVQVTIQTLQQFAATAATGGSGGATGLVAQINALERSIPEVRHSSSTDSAKSPAAASAPTSADSLPPQSPGLIALGSQWFALRSARRQLQDALQQTDDLSKALDELRGRLTSEVRSLLKSSLAGPRLTDPTLLAAARAEINAATVRFKQLSTLLVPLSEEDISIDNTRSTLAELEGTIKARAGATARRLALHLAILAASILLIVAISSIWRRATFRYLHDARRRRQFLALRRIVTGLALTLIIVMAFVSEVGSLATYVGFLTAGLAVALQNVILAIVAYFFLIGRYGVRVGDRITLAGVTGRVVEIGLIRIYLMELAGVELRSTGRMIVLSNAVLFQPSALFKQIPGADYTWHTVVLTLAPGADLTQAQTRLKSAADSAFEKYRASIERQFAAVQRLVDFDSAAPSPEIHVRFTEKGLEFSVRYPVEAEHAAAIDQNMVSTLRAALDEAPQLPLAESGAPVLKAD